MTKSNPNGAHCAKRPLLLAILKVLVAMPLALLWSAQSEAQQLGTVYCGANNALTRIQLCDDFSTYRVDDLGVVFGFMLPITTGRIDVQYNTRAGINGVKAVTPVPSPHDSRSFRKMEHYASVLNEVLIGRKLDLSRRVYVEPMVGMGFLLHLLWGNGGHGFAYGTFEVGLTAQVMYRFKHVETGTMLSFQYIPYDGYLDTSGARYVSAAVVLSR